MMFKKLLLLCVMLIPTLALTVRAQDATPTATPLPAIMADPSKYKVEEILRRTFITSVVWASDGRMFWTEKGGVVGVMAADGTVQDDPVLTVEVRTLNEEGLLSMVLDPKFDDNHYFYVFYTSPPSVSHTKAADLVVRYTLDGGTAKAPLELLRIEIADDSANQHNGGRLKFGPKDGFLYLTIGDLGNRLGAGNFNAITSKFHRFAVLNDKLVAAPGNPFPGDSTWVSGLRNNFEFAFDPVNNLIFATENGPECDDEIDLIIPGQDYGWAGNTDCSRPLVERQASGVKPLVSWTPTIAPTGIIVYSGAPFPEWDGKLFYCSWNVGLLNYFDLNEKHTKLVGDQTNVPLPEDVQCRIELAQGPDGNIYFSDVTRLYKISPADTATGG
ncbi:MAG: PQQ-dependent sugar dehydrogenase [Chloroflexota bacterium]